MMFRKSLWKAMTATIATTTTRTTSSRTLSSTILPQEISLVCADGTKLAGQSWKCNNQNDGNPNHPSSLDQYPPTTTTRHILCLHGWMDNCRSFYQISPALASNGNNYHVIALDLPGHGRSSHKSIDAPPMVHSEMVFYVSEAIEELYNQGIWQHQPQKEKPQSTTTNDDNVEHSDPNGRSVTLIGHSLGAGIASLYASCFPEQIDQMILLDGAGFIPREAMDVSKHVRNHVTRRSIALRRNSNRKTPKRGYPTIESAIKQRLQSTLSMPGNQTLSYDVARELVIRAMHLDNDSDDDDSKTTGQPTVESPLLFRHDSRFAWPSMQYMTKEQNDGIFQELGKARIDTCILLAENGWPFKEETISNVVSLLQPRILQTLPGSHYLHADPESVQQVINSVSEFLSKKKDNT